MKTMWLPSYATRSERLCRFAVVTFAFAVLIFLIGPLFVVFPLSVSKDPFFTSTLSKAETSNKQAVLDTTHGVIVLDLLADAAPTHVAHFITRAREGAYDGTVFHRIIAMGIIQGGDPLSKDPS